jgi:hypothetical protein
MEQNSISLKTQKLIHRASALLVALITWVVYFKTVQPSVSFWDCGEAAAAAYGLQVPHPPGSPFFTLMGRLFSMIPVVDNIGLRMNLLSVTVSAFSAMLLFLIIVKLIENFTGRGYKSFFDLSANYGAAMIGALAWTFSHSFWFNGTESEIYATNTFVFVLIVYFGMRWYERADNPDNSKYIVLIAYLIGISTTLRSFGILAFIPITMIFMFKKYVDDEDALKKSGYILLGHIGLLAVMAIGMWAFTTSTDVPDPEKYKAYDTEFIIAIGLVSVIWMGIFWKKVFTRNSIYIAIFIGAFAKFFILTAVVKYIPILLGLIAGTNKVAAIVVIIGILGGLGYLSYWAYQRKNQVLHIATLVVLFIIVGYSSYAMIVIRANMNPPMNENAPVNFTEMLTYLNREQYGDFPTFKRRFSPETHQQGIYTNYSSDLEFLWKYQMNHMMTRYILWTYGGREGWMQDDGVNIWPFNGVGNFLGKAFDLKFAGDAHNSMYGIPFLIGLIGLFYHFRKDWKMATAFLFLFIFVSYLFAFYQNQQEPQPRERDKFYACMGFAYAIWIGLGARGIIELILDKLPAVNLRKPLAATALVLLFVFVPGRMLVANYHEHDRSQNWLPWDFAYNMLQSCEPNAILFTNGDNDTFPLWYLQDVEGVRRDVRIANLSLINTPWYIKQLKYETPYGTPVVDIQIPDEEIEKIQPVQFEAQTYSIEVPKEVYKQFGITDTASINSGKVTFRMSPTLGQGDVQGIRAQDIMVREIVMRNNWRRPIYFAVTCSEDCKVGLGNYCKLEGLCYRLTPERITTEGASVNIDLTRKCLFNEDPGYSKTYSPSFKFRGVADPNVFFDENMERMIQNYRSSFMRIALAYQSTGQADKCVEALNKMEQLMPRSKIKLDYRLLMNVANLYRESGDTKSFNTIASDIEVEALKTISAGPVDINSSYNPYQMLMSIYESQGKVQKEILLLQKMKAEYPEVAAAVDAKIAALKAQQAQIPGK